MKVYCLVLAVLLLFMELVPYNNGQQYNDDDSDLEVISSCQNKYANKACCEDDANLNIIIAATLDGTVTALNGDTGELLWMHEDTPLLSGTLISSDPIDIGGTSLQLMPTLDGRLFSYTHNSNLIEPLPITTDSLLESTIRLGQDAVAGGKSVTTKGFDLITGEQKYKCSMDSCGNGNAEISENPVLLVKRITNSIRAMDTLRGIERWNLSTSEVDISLAGMTSTSNTQPSNLKVLLQPPDGVIVARNRYNLDEWKTNVKGHIVSVWQVDGNQIREISIFDPSNIFTTQYEVMHREQHNLQSQSSLLYMGTSSGIPFIIQSPKAKQNLKKKMNSLPDLFATTELTGTRFCSANDESRSLAYDVKDETLRLVLKSAFSQSHSRAIEDKSTGSASTNTRRKLQIIAPGSGVSPQKIGSENLRSTSMSPGGDYGYLVLESEPHKSKLKLSSPSHFWNNVCTYVFNPSVIIGFFAGIVGVMMTAVYKKWTRGHRKMIEQCSSTESTSASTSKTTSITFAHTGDEDKVLEEASDRSSVSSSTPVGKTLPPNEKSNFKTAQRASRATPARGRAETHAIDTDEDSMSQNEKNRLLRNRTISRSSLEGFTSRFANEFEVKKFIGHGGFGVVFRAQSITDMNEYAVKRIAVADNEKARNRVLREARALAMLDHPGIIRYFYAWEERPPKGYQEEEDEILLGKIKAEKLAKLQKVEERRKHTHEEKNIKSAEISFAESFEMPPVVGNTGELEDSWSVSARPKEVGGKRTTSESQRCLYADVESDSSEESSSQDDEPKIETVYSSSCSIKFTNGSDEFDNEEEEEAKKQLEVIDEQLLIHNRAIIVETETHELEVRQRNDMGDCVYLYIVMQLCAEKSLEDWIRRNKTKESRPMPSMKDWIRQLASGLDYLHNKGFIHRDFKPGNVFFSLDSKPDHQILKIGDLGLATKTDEAPKASVSQDSDTNAKHTRNVGTRSYMSPEQIGHQQYTEKVDIFALGLVATELIIPFSTVSERIYTFADYQKGKTPAILDNNDPELCDFLLQLTNIDPSKRPSASIVSTHSFLQ